MALFWTTHFGRRLGDVGHAETCDEIRVDGSLGESNFMGCYSQGSAVQAVLGGGKDAAVAMLAESMRKILTLEQARSAAAQT